MVLVGLFLSSNLEVINIFKWFWVRELICYYYFCDMIKFDEVIKLIK